MSSIIDNDDKIFVMFQRYRTLLERDATTAQHIRTTQLVASQLTLAHMIDHVVCLLKDKGDSESS